MSVGHQIAMALRSAYWAMHRQADAVLRPHDLTADQFVLLSILAGQDNITQQQLVGLASSDPNTVRAMLLILERRGFVTREPHPTDGRARSVALTPLGRRTYQRVWKNSERFREGVVAAVEKEHVERLIADLKRLSDAMASPAGRGRRPRRKSTANQYRSKPESLSPV
jgi:DNA-binding MarR family transcriptional regulator